MRRPLLVSAVLYALYVLIFACGVWFWTTHPFSERQNQLVMEIEYFGKYKQDSAAFFINDSGAPIFREIKGSGQRTLRVPLVEDRLFKLRIDPTSITRRSFKIQRIYLEPSGSAAIELPKLDDTERVLLSGIEPAAADSMRASARSASIRIAVNETLPKTPYLPPWEYLAFGAALIGLWLGTLFVWKSAERVADLKAAPASAGIVLCKRQVAAAAAVGLAYALYLVICNPFIEKTPLIVNNVPPGLNSLRLHWDDGRGFSSLGSIKSPVKNGKAEFSLPQIYIQSIKFAKPLPGNTKVSLLAQGKQIDLKSSSKTFAIPHASRAKTSTTLIVLQVLCGAVVAIATLGLLILFACRSRWTALLLTQQRYYFATFFLFALPPYLFWLLGQWPGAATQDSAFIWSVAKSYRFSADHPSINSLAYSLLQQFWDSASVVGILQIGITAAAFAYVFHYLYRIGCPLWMLTIFGLLCVTSVPVGLYNVILWKDIPFSVAILFWGFFFFKSCMRAQLEGQKLDLSRCTIIFLALSTCAFYFRHGGQVYALLIIALLIISRFFTWKTVRELSVLCLALCFFFTRILPWCLKEDQSNLPFYKTFSILNVMGALYINDYFTEDRQGDTAAFVKFVPHIENLRAYASSNLAPIHNKGVRTNISEADSAEILRRIGTAVMLNPGLFLSDRIAIFFSILNEPRPNHYGMTYYNLLLGNLLPKTYADPNALYLQRAPLFPQLEARQSQFITLSQRSVKGFQGKHLYWNSILQFFLLIGGLLLARWLPASALYCFFILSFAGIVFLLTPTNNFRYLYFVYLGGLPAIPIFYTELKQRVLAWRRGKAASATPDC